MSDETKPQDSAAMSPASAGSWPFAWAADIPGKYGAAPTVLFGYTEKLVKSIAAAGGDLAQPFPLYRHPVLTDEELDAIALGAELLVIREDDLPSENGRFSCAAATLRALLERLVK